MNRESQKNNYPILELSQFKEVYGVSNESIYDQLNSCIKDVDQIPIEEFISTIRNIQQNSLMDMIFEENDHLSCNSSKVGSTTGYADQLAKQFEINGMIRQFEIALSHTIKSCPEKFDMLEDHNKSLVKRIIDRVSRYIPKVEMYDDKGRQIHLKFLKLANSGVQFLDIKFDNQGNPINLSFDENGTLILPDENDFENLEKDSEGNIINYGKNENGEITIFPIKKVDNSLVLLTEYYDQDSNRVRSPFAEFTSSSYDEQGLYIAMPSDIGEVMSWLWKDISLQNIDLDNIDINQEIDNVVTNSPIYNTRLSEYIKYANEYTGVITGNDLDLYLSDLFGISENNYYLLVKLLYRYKDEIQKRIEQYEIFDQEDLDELSTQNVNEENSGAIILKSNEVIDLIPEILTDYSDLINQRINDGKLIVISRPGVRTSVYNITKDENLSQILIFDPTSPSLSADFTHELIHILEYAINNDENEHSNVISEFYSQLFEFIFILNQIDQNEELERSHEIILRSRMKIAINASNFNTFGGTALSMLMSSFSKLDPNLANFTIGEFIEQVYDEVLPEYKDQGIQHESTKEYKDKNDRVVILYTNEHGVESIYTYFQNDNGERTFSPDDRYTLENFKSEFENYQLLNESNYVSSPLQRLINELNNISTFNGEYFVSGLYALGSLLFFNEINVNPIDIFNKLVKGNYKSIDEIHSAIYEDNLDVDITTIFILALKWHVENLNRLIELKVQAR